MTNKLKNKLENKLEKNIKILEEKILPKINEIKKTKDFLRREEFLEIISLIADFISKNKLIIYGGEAYK